MSGRGTGVAFTLLLKEVLRQIRFGPSRLLVRRLAPAEERYEESRR